MAQKKVAPGISPGAGRSVSASLPPLTAKELKSLIQDSVNEAMSPFVSQIRSLENKLEGQQKDITEVKKEMGKLETASKECKQKLSKNETKTCEMAKKQQALEKEILNYQLDRMQSVIRIQNFKETEKEKLGSRVAEWLAPSLGITKDILEGEILEIYRTTSAHIRKFNLEREVFMRLSTRKRRNEILKIASDNQLMLDNVKIRILKDIPFSIRERRRNYKDLVTLLQKNNIRFMWVFPEGVKFSYNNEDFKINSEGKIGDFIKRFGEKLGSQKVFVSDSAGRGEEKQSEEEEEEDDEEDEDEKRGAAAPKYRLRVRKKGKDKKK